MRTKDLSIRKNRRLSSQEVKTLSRELSIRFRMHLATQGLKEGDILPGEKEMSSRYKVPLSIVRGLYQSLKDEAVIGTGRGRGIVLLKPFQMDKELVENRSFLKLAIVAFLQPDNPRAPFNRASGILRFFDHMSAEHQCETRLFNTMPGFTVEYELMEAIRQYRPDGILYVSNASTATEENIRRLRMLDIPMVACGEKTSLTNNVDFDNFQIASVAMEHLIRLGHKKIAFLQIAGNHSWQLERIEGVKKTMEKHGLEIIDDDIVMIESLSCIKESVNRFVKAVFKSANMEYSAVFCSGDEIAAALIAELRSIGMSVPEDISVVSVDDDPFLRHLDITTVAHSGEEEGRAGFDFLSEIIRLRPSSPMIRKIKCHLLLRSSTAESNGEFRNTPLLEKAGRDAETKMMNADFAAV